MSIDSKFRFFYNCFAVLSQVIDDPNWMFNLISIELDSKTS